jgi:hypothetical protein
MRKGPVFVALGTGVVVAVAGLFLGCHPAPPPSGEDAAADGPAWFEDVTEQVGLHFVHEAGPTGAYFLPQILGSGGALFDCDGDGLLDIYLIHNAGPGSRATNRLFRQTRDGRFEDISAGSGLDVSGYGMGVAIADVNNDGFPDVLLTEYGGCRLFLNDGKGRFTEATDRLGARIPVFATSACFFDYDRDGWLDLVVANYVQYDPATPCRGNSGKQDYCHPSMFPGSVSRLYHNRGRGPDGRWLGFEDVTLKSRLGLLPGAGLGVVCADFDGDGWPDIFIAHDALPNRLWLNQHDGTFREAALARGVALDGQGETAANMGIALGDVNGDGLFDLYVTHLTAEMNTLWQQGPRGYFQDRTAGAGLTATGWRGTGFGTVLADFDHDGALDLALVNGRVTRALAAEPGTAASFWSQYAQRNQLLTGDGRGHFRDLSAAQPSFCHQPGVYRALIYGDVNNDGALDLLVTQTAGPARLFRNTAPKRGHWLMVSAVDPACGGRDAYGAEITVHAGDRRWVRWLTPGSSYLCSNDPRAHFGLGENERVERIHILWPDGTAEDFAGGKADRCVKLKKGQGTQSPRR